jgi:hypothetical protein
MIRRLFALLLAIGCADGQASGVACPQRLRVQSQRGALVDARLFIGLPEQQRELLRPANQQQWVLAKLHRRAAASNAGLYLQCRYQGMLASVTIPVPLLATACFIDRSKAGETTVYCE